MIRKQEHIIRKLLITIIISLGIFLFLISQNIIQYGTMMQEYSNNDIYSALAPQEIGLKKGKPIIQSFVSTKDNLYSFSLKFNQARLEENVKVDVSLYDTKGTKLQEWTVGRDSLEYDSYISFILDSLLLDTKGHTYYIIVEGDNLEKILLGSESDSLKEGCLYIDGKEQSGDLAIKFTNEESVMITLFYGGIFSLLCGGLTSAFIFLKLWKKIISMSDEVMTNFKKNWKKVIRVGAYTMILFAISYLIEKVCLFYLSWKGNNPITDFNEYRFAFVFVLFFLIFLYIQYKEFFEKKPEIIVLISFVLIGTLFVVSIPAEAELSWDAAIHYWRAVGVSHALDGKANIAENWLYWHSGIGYNLPGTIESLKSGYQNIQNLYNLGIETTANISILRDASMIAYIPSTIGLAIGRILHFPYNITFQLGAFMNMLLYVFVTYFALKKLRSGKMILVVIIGTPVSLFLAAVYSYDSWITAFSILGLAYFIGCMQEGVVRKQDEWIMLGALMLAFIVKPIYFLVFLVLLILPRKSFDSDRECIKFKISAVAASIAYAAGMVLGLIEMILIFVIAWIIVAGCVLFNQSLNKRKRILIWGIVSSLVIVIGFVMIVLVLPQLVGSGDARGGALVNAGEQVKFILSNPVQYFLILVKYIVTRYLAYDDQLQGLFNTFGYIGQSSFAIVSFIFLWIVSFTDKREADVWERYNITKLVSAGICLATIMLMATALYIDFTSVANDTIEGCQIRYVMPLMFLFFGLIGSNNIINKIKNKTYNILVVAGTNILLMLNLWQIVISKYS